VRIWSSHFEPGVPGRPPVLVPDGFSPAALLLGWLALLRPHSWGVGLAAGAVSTFLLLLLRYHPALWPLMPGFHLLLGLFAFDLRRFELRLAGFVPGPSVAGASQDAALLRLLERAPGVVRPAAAP
jgi:hypothetical protein